jgi:hypothetical protein
MPSIPAQRDSDAPTAAACRRITRDLHYVATSWPDLLESRLKGTPRPWAERIFTADEKTAADDLAKLERRERAYGIGDHPAPLHLDVLDTITEVACEMLELEDAVRDALGFGPADRRLPARGADDVWVADAAAWLAASLTTVAGHVALLEHVTAEAALMASAVRSSLGESECTLIKAPCIACGQMTLRLFCAHDRLADSYVLCTNRGCDPDSKVCGARLRGFPFWPLNELDWLNDRIDQAAAVKKV